MEYLTIHHMPSCLIVVINMLHMYEYVDAKLNNLSRI